jgi:acetoacetyl-CoA reductase
MAEKLEGKVALVTGGAGGIGTAICMRLVDAGCRVVTNYRNEEKAAKWRETMKAQGYEIPMFKADVGDYKECEAMVAQIEKEIGPIDILVNNAGVTRDASFRRMTHEQWETVITSNLDSVYNVTHPVIESMTNRGWGRVINISSVNGQKGQFGQANYSAAKAGMHGFTMAVAQEVARKGVTVNTLSPGYIGTEMVKAVPAEILNKIIAQIPVGRLGTPEEVAYCVEFLASDEAGFITGAEFSMNGGQHMQ